MCRYIKIFTICTCIVYIYIYVYTAPRKSWYVHFKGYPTKTASEIIRGLEKHQASSWSIQDSPKCPNAQLLTCFFWDITSQVSPLKKQVCTNTVPQFQWTKLPNVQISTLRVEVISLRKPLWRIDIGIHWECLMGLENSRKQKNWLVLVKTCV